MRRSVEDLGTITRTREGAVTGGAEGGRIARFIFSVLFLVVVASPSGALEYKNGDFRLDFDTTLSYGAAWRISEQSDYLLGGIKGQASQTEYESRNDGDKNFDKKSLVTNAFNIKADIDARYKSFGVFVRPRFFYDAVYDRPNDNDDPLTNNQGPLYGGGTSQNDHFTSATKDAHRNRFDILDAFAYGSETFGGHIVDLRVGRQVVNWGESLFVANGIASAQSPLDVTQAFTPGVELRDIYLPTGQAVAKVGLGGGFTLSGYYQWEWAKHRLPEAGSYYSSVDYADDAGKHVLLPLDLTPFGIPATVRPTIDRGNDKEAKDSGQWGVTLRYLSDALANTEFGLYYVNYHAKDPMIRSAFNGKGTISPQAFVPGVTWGVPLLDTYDTASYWFEYAENIKLIGASVSTVLWGANVGVEASYRKHVPVAVNDATVPLGLNYEDGEYAQVQLSFLDTFPSTFLYDQLAWAGEIGYGRTFGVDSGDYYKIPDLKYSRSSWGFTTTVNLEWFNVLQGIDLNVPIAFAANPRGTSTIGTFTEGADSLSVGLGITYQKNMKAILSYTNYLGDKHHNVLSDRDTVSFNLKYTF